MTVLLMISAAAGDLLQGIVWLLTFTGMRKYSGGWHASTRFRCFLSYQAVFVLMLMCSGFITDLRIIVCTFLGSVSYTIRNAPVQHIFNPLSEQEKLKNRKRLIRNLIAVSIVFAGFSLNKSSYAFTMCYASAWNAVCMMLLKHSDMWRRI